MPVISDDLIAYAGAIAPHIDRLSIAVHRHGRPAGRALLEEFGLPGGGTLIDARPILLAGPITLDDLATVERFARREDLGSALDEYVGQGILSRDDQTEPAIYSTTARGQDLLLRLTDLHARTIAALWAVHGELLAELVALATLTTGYAAAALPLEHYPAFRLQHATPVPLGAPPAYVLLLHLTALRYLRADAHATALAAHQLDAIQATTLTVLWRSAIPPTVEEIAANHHIESEALDAALAALGRRGLVQEQRGRWLPTAEGRATRDTIELETNRRAAPPFTALGADERAALLAGLQALPD
ncbi:MAG TPA: hypothetical protein VFE42_20170 [Chloroflexota bacterium]|nr:hypothetical protein [Chloroflexota bacterium]